MHQLSRFLLISGLLLAVVLQDSFAQAEFRKYSNSFLSIGVGGRAHGMGGAVTATASDVFSSQWNPAGLAAMDAPMQVGAMHAEWFAGVINYDFLGIAREVNRDKSAYAAISVVRMGIDNIPNTINLFDPDGSINYDNISSFSAADYGIFLSYAQAMGDSPVRFGGNVKVINRRIGPFATAWGFGLDVGFQYRKDKLYLGAMGKDITTTFNAWSFSFTDEEKRILQETGNLVPKQSTELTAPSLILAGAYEISTGAKSLLLVEADLNFTFDGQRNTLISSSVTSIDPRVGLEFAYNERLYVRAGMGNVQKVSDDFNPDQRNTIVQPHFGIGVSFGRLSIDYALTNVGTNQGTSFSHIFSLLLDLARSK